MMDDARIAALAERLEAMGAPIGLSIDLAYRVNVARSLAALLDAAALLAEFPLAEDVEPAPIFQP